MSVEEAPLVTVESGLQLVAAIVLAGIILFELGGLRGRIQQSDRYFTAFTLFLASAAVCFAVFR